MSDQDLPSRGERVVAFESIFRNYFHDVDRYVRFRYPDVDVDDLVARTFDVAWRRLEDAPEGAIRGWLLAIATNHARNAYRAQRRGRSFIEGLAPLSNPYSTNHDHALPVEVADQLRQALDRLNSRDREVIVLGAIMHLNGEELGAALGVSAATAQVRLYRARQQLAKVYGGER